MNWLQNCSLVGATCIVLQNWPLDGTLLYWLQNLPPLSGTCTILPNWPPDVTHLHWFQNWNWSPGGATFGCQIDHQVVPLAFYAFPKGSPPENVCLSIWALPK